jgi:type VI secretion system protein ImpC
MTAKRDHDKQAVVRKETAVLPSLLDEVVTLTRLKPKDEEYALTRTGVEALISHFMKPARRVDRISKAMIDDMIAEIDKRISLQMDVILHDSLFQKLESAWRSLQFLVDRTDFRENIRLELLNVSKDELLQDFEDSPEVTKSGFYKTVYSAEYGQFGGNPYANIIANYDFDPGPQDMKLLQYVSSVSAMAHAPFVAAAGPGFFGLDSFDSLANLKDLKSIFEGPRYIKWKSFRESENARYIALTLPRFLLRLPYGADTQSVETFNYEENVSACPENYLWGNTAFAFATRLTDSFAKYRWCTNIIGPLGGGTVEDLPLYQFQSMGALQTRMPTEVLVSDRLEFELAEEGFISLALRKDSDNLCFFSANSVQKQKYFGTGPENKEAELNYKLGSQLPYMFAANRLAHYLKVIQRENIGSWKGKTDLERELNAWIRQYVANQDNPSPEIRSRRPLRQAQITVEDVEGETGWYKVGVKVRPHFKYMGAYFTLSLVGKLDEQ